MVIEWRRNSLTKSLAELQSVAFSPQPTVLPGVKPQNCYIRVMKRGAKTLIFAVFLGLLGSSMAKALAPDAAANPYEGIMVRNIFGLKPPPPLPRPEDLKQPPSDIKLSGIITILGKRALLKTQTPARPPLPAKEESYILAEGQRDGDIEVLTIDDKAGTVKVKNHGVDQTLDFVNNGIKLPSVAQLPLAAAPSLPAPPPLMNIPPPGARPGMRQIPTRPVRGTFSGGNEQASAAPVQTSTGTGSMLGQAFGAGSTPGFTSGPDYGVSGDEQTLLIEANRARLREEGKAEDASLLPPTDLTPAEGQPLLPQ